VVVVIQVACEFHTLHACKMSFAVCSSDLENLVAKPSKESGMGLLWMTNKRGTRFILEYMSRAIKIGCAKCMRLGPWT
jgi:hypothetical protein